MADEIVIFDSDGTLADVSERIHHLKKKHKNWEAFFQGIAQDKAIQSMVRLCNIRFQPVNYHDLLLRKDKDRRSDTVVKREMPASIDKSRVLFVVEDRSRVVEMWHSEGLVCLQYAPGEF